MSVSYLKLEGQLKCDVYENGRIIRSSEWKDNYITNSGVKYPYFFAFADCFRFLSLGTGNKPNSTGTAQISETTGLDKPVPEFSYLGREYFSTGTPLAGGGCGNVGNGNIITLIREWSLPDATGGVFTKAYPFSEFMLTPGKPPNTGYVAQRWINYDNPPIVPTGFCNCDHQGQLNTGANGQLDGPIVTGVDSDPAGKYYQWLFDWGAGETATEINSSNTEHFRTRMSPCSATKAFSRILQSNPVTSGQSLQVTYKLNITFDTGRSGAVFAYGPLNTPNWERLGYIANLVNPGIKLINDGSFSSCKAPNTYERLQQDNYSSQIEGITDYPKFYQQYSNTYGCSFVPSRGVPLEPSMILGPGGSLVAMFSDDNTQFLVNEVGGYYTGGGVNKIQNSGLMPFRSNVTGITLNIDDGNDNNYWSRNPRNIRMYDSNLIMPPFPYRGDILQNAQFTYSWNDYYSTPPAYFAAPVCPTPRFYYSGRYAYIALTFAFQNFEDQQYYSLLPARSLILNWVDPKGSLTEAARGGKCDTLSYYDGDNQNFVPFYDCLLSGIFGSDVFLPSVDNNNQIINSLSPDFNFLKKEINSRYPSLTTVLSWQAECPPDVTGCPPS